MSEQCIYQKHIRYDERGDVDGGGQGMMESREKIPRRFLTVTVSGGGCPSPGFSLRPPPPPPTPPPFPDS